MAKSRSRSPRWKYRPPAHRSLEPPRQRHFSDEGLRREARRPVQWEEERHLHNNSRVAPYNRFNDKPFEHNSFPQNIRKSPLEPAGRLKRMYSPERHGENNRRFPPKFPVDAPPRDHDRNAYHHRNQGRNIHNDANGFRPGRREENIQGNHEPYHRESEWARHENEDHWNKDAPLDQHFHQARRNSEERGSFQKRYPEDRNFREHVQPPKRPRETERLDFPPPPRNSHWKPDHTFRPGHDKDWSKETNFRRLSPIVHRANSGEFMKIEYDYSHRSPHYVGGDLLVTDDYNEKHNRQEDRKSLHAKGSLHNKLSDGHMREKGKHASERLQESSPKYSSKKCHTADRDFLKNDVNMKPQNHKYKERGRNDNNQRKEETPPNNQLHLSPNSSVSNAALKTNPSVETITVNLSMKKPTDKYRHDINPSDRQMSQDLVMVDRKETFRPVFEHLDTTTVGMAKGPKTEFTQEIITIIHEVKANHFQSSDLTLHERFSKLQGESNSQDVNQNKILPQTNPEIHRRINISLEDIQSKTVNRTEAPPPNHRVIEDPNDLRHDIERRRKERLQGEEDGGSDVTFPEREASNNYYRPQNHESGEFHKSSRLPRPPFRKSSGRTPGSYCRGKTNQFYSSQSRFENTDEIRRPYKGRGDATTGV
ncbi:BCLAF1 and THRAP3 family member 3 [Pelodytes ibericus]